MTIEAFRQCEGAITHIPFRGLGIFGSGWQRHRSGPARVPLVLQLDRASAARDCRPLDIIGDSTCLCVG